VVRGVLALGIVVMHQQVEEWFAAGGGEFHHGDIAVRVAAHQDGRTPDVQLDVDRLAGTIVERLDDVPSLSNVAIRSAGGT